jgi:hypothetical protein
MHNNQIGSQRACRKCEEFFPADKEHFYWNRKKQCFHNWCKQCCISHGQAIKSSYARTRPLSSDPTDAFFIALRNKISCKHRTKGFAGEAITTCELIELHRSSGKCGYTGLEYTLTNDKSPLRVVCGRKDPSLGYIKENIILCCWFVSCAKNKWTLEQLIPLWSYLPKVLDPIS